jgi:2,4-dienoyl-CoA reductase-like NADH-dependent reductase (Old Yellow Enzyme family)
MDGAGASEACQLAARNAEDLPGLERLVEGVRKYGARMFMQLHHPGRNYARGSEQPVAASAVENPATGRTPRELTKPEIEQITAAFVNGARIAQIAGADGVELHGACNTSTHRCAPGLRWSIGCWERVAAAGSRLGPRP